jgi:hypothetical protein
MKARGVYPLAYFHPKAQSIPNGIGWNYPATSIDVSIAIPKQSRQAVFKKL